MGNISETNGNLKVACFTPLQPVRSGISDYSEELTKHLVPKGLDIEFIYEKHPPSNPFIQNNCSYLKHSKFPEKFKNGDYDVIIYHIGNNEIHNYMYDYMFDYPGIIVLHDYVLHHSRLAKHVRGLSLGEYVEEMSVEGKSRLGKIISSGMGSELLYYLFPMNFRPLDSAKMIVVHNTYLARTILKEHPSQKVKVIPHHAERQNVPQKTTEKLRAKIGIPDDGVIVASFGFMNEMKRISLIADVLRDLIPSYPDLYYLICGEDKEGIVRKSYFDYPGIKDKIKISGYVENKDRFIEYIEMSDIVVNLRFPSAGETSGTMTRSMGQGKPVIVYDLPTLSDLPDDILVKIPFENDFKELSAVLEKLILSPELRVSIGKSAGRYVQEHLSRPLVADMYYAAIKECQQS